MLQKILIPLIVVLIIVAVLIFLLNPSERLREVRDNQRLSDLTNLKNAIETYISNNAKEIASDKSSFCGNCQPNSVYSYSSLASSGDFQNIVKQGAYVNGTGWLPLDLSKNAKIGTTPLLLLPLDPRGQNIALLKKIPLLNILVRKVADFSYTFTASKAGKYKLTASMESKKGLEAAAGDNGSSVSRLEVGTDLNLKP